MNLEEARMLQATNASTAPDDRATSFQPTEGGTEQRSGATLLVEAYAIIWTLLMVWLVLLWRKQAALNLRIDGLEGAIIKASARGPGGHPPNEVQAASAAAKPASAEGAPAGKLGGQPS
jgi:CcmD family protein